MSWEANITGGGTLGLRPICGKTFRISSGTKSLKKGGGGGSIGTNGGPIIGSSGGDGGSAGNTIAEGKPLEAHDFRRSSSLRLRKASL